MYCMYVDLSTALTRRLDIDKAAVRLSSDPGLDDGCLAFDVALFLGDGRMSIWVHTSEVRTDMLLPLVLDILVW